MTDQIHPDIDQFTHLLSGKEKRQIRRQMRKFDKSIAYTEHEIEKEKRSKNSYGRIHQFIERLVGDKHMTADLTNARNSLFIQIDRNINMLEDSLATKKQLYQEFIEAISTWLVFENIDKMIEQVQMSLED